MKAGKMGAIDEDIAAYPPGFNGARLEGREDGVRLLAVDDVLLGLASTEPGLKAGKMGAPTLSHRPPPTSRFNGARLEGREDGAATDIGGSPTPSLQRSPA